MAIPDFQTLMLPLLRLLGDGAEHRAGQATDELSDVFGLTAEERQEPLASGSQPRIRNKVGWACTYLKKAGLIESPARGVYRLTSRGRSVLDSGPERVDMKYLERFPEYVTWRDLRHEGAETKLPEQDASVGITPEEALDAAYRQLRVDLELDILDQVKAASPGFFERLVVELLVRMGYGGSLSDAGQAVGRSGDGGIDGIIKEDRLGLDVIYIQAKKWDNTVGRPEIQKFAGALQGHRARKGVFLTTASFSSEAITFASGIDSKIVLIDGPTLAKYMIDSNLGCSPSQTYEVKSIDSDFFLEE